MMNRCRDCCCGRDSLCLTAASRNFILHHPNSALALNNYDKKASRKKTIFVFCLSTTEIMCQKSLFLDRCHCFIFFCALKVSKKKRKFETEQIARKTNKRKDSNSENDELSLPLFLFRNICRFNEKNTIWVPSNLPLSWRHWSFIAYGWPQFHKAFACFEPLYCCPFAFIS